MAEVKTRRRNLIRTESCDTTTLVNKIQLSKPIHIREKSIKISSDI
jgi:hypothetical protein